MIRKSTLSMFIFAAPALVAVTVGITACTSEPSPPSIDIWTAAAEGNTYAIKQHIVAGTDINETFIAEGVPGYGGTPLHMAASANQKQVAELLLEAGADINAKAADYFEGTPLHWAAAAAANVEMVKLLVEAGANVNAEDMNGATPLDGVLVWERDIKRQEKDEIADYLRQNGSKVTINIWTAASVGLVDIVEQRIADGWDIDGTFVAEGVLGSGGSPLHIAVLSDQKEVAEFLIDNGADLNAKADDEYGGTPLHWAAAFGKQQMVILLVEAGADVNAPDNNGFTPLDAVVTFDPEMESQVTREIADYLKEHGAENRVE